MVAPHEAVGRQGRDLGRDAAADIRHRRAARIEAAAGRISRDRGHDAGDFLQPLAAAPRALAQRCLNFCYAALLQRAPTPDRPEYAGMQLVRPEGYREWIYLSSGLGMEYNPTDGAPENFTNIFYR